MKRQFILFIFVYTIFLFSCEENNKNIVVKSIKLNSTTLNLRVGENFTLTALVKPENAIDKTLIWTSDNESVVTVDANGLIKGISKGTTNIIVTSKNKTEIFARCIVNIAEFFTITFNSNNGSAVTEQTIESGGKVTKPKVPTNEGFAFLAWYKDESLTNAFDFDNDIISANITLYAKWGFTLTFNSTGGSEVAKQVISSGSKATKPTDPKYNSNTFAGWYKDETLNTIFDFDNEVITANTTIYAKWNATILFYRNGGSAVEPLNVKRGSYADKPNDPIYYPNTFAGWYKEIEFINSFNFTSETITENFTLYAKWDLFNEVTNRTGFNNRSQHTSVVFDYKMWVIGGFDGSSKNDVWYSSDGVKWVQATSNAGFKIRSNHSSVVYDNKMWVIGGYVGFNQNDVWNSSDGVTWTKIVEDAEFSERIGQTSLVFDNKIWVIGGRDNNYKFKNDVWWSSNGIKWTKATENAGFSGRINHTSVVFDEKMWVIGGDSGVYDKIFNDVWYSSNGVNWEEATTSAQFRPRHSHTSVVFDDKIWIIAGNSGYNYLQNDIWYSSDGSNWIKGRDKVEFGARKYHTSVVFDKKIWVIGGENNGYKSDVWKMD